MNVEDTGPVVDPRIGLAAAVEDDEREARLTGRRSSAFLRARLQASCEAFIERYGQDEEPEDED